MSDDKALKFGQTPWDDLDRDELIHHIERLYMATVSLYGVARQCKASDERESGLRSYWGVGGNGGNSIEEGRQAIEAAQNGYDEESIYRARTRYSRDLLFEDTDYTMVRWDWAMCPVCKRAIGRGPDGQTHYGKRCRDAMPLNNNCNGILRHLTWDDLQPPSTTNPT